MLAIKENFARKNATVCLNSITGSVCNVEIPSRELRQEYMTACPWCEHNFKETVNANGDKMKVLDILEIVKQAI